ncbi:MAG: acyl carrier protein [Clostridia bacterium]|nr:acyl carrier protein [Clostridia bacterium]
MTLEKVQAIIADQLDIDTDKITNETSLSEDLGADSLDIVEMIMSIEDEFGIEIDDDDAKGFKTIADLIAYIDAKL